MNIVSDNPDPKPLRPYCQTCGWRKGGPDSWNGVACKCGHTEPPIQPLPAHLIKEYRETADDA